MFKSILKYRILKGGAEKSKARTEGDSQKRMLVLSILYKSHFHKVIWLRQVNLQKWSLAAKVEKFHSSYPMNFFVENW